METHDDYNDYGDNEADEIARLHYETMQNNDQFFAETAQAAVEVARKRPEDNEVVASIPDLMLLKRKRHG